jgi:putative membrane protein
MPSAKDSPGSRNSHLRLPLILLGLALVVAVLLGIAPKHRDDWVLENALAVAGLVLLVLSYRRLRLSRFSYVLLFTLFVLHEVGAHYTYSEVPYDAWLEHLTGWRLSERFGLQRNGYDRLVHFSYGLLIAFPFRELFVRVADARGFWGYFLPLDVVMSTSMLYELIEWGAAAVMGNDLGQAYLGTQGDVWDAQKDMLCATIGAALALAIIAGVQRAMDRDFQREWAESLRVKKPVPLGEADA